MSNCANALALCQRVGTRRSGLWGREIPSFCMRNWSVGRFRPSRAAAPFGPANTQLVCSKTDRICLRSTSSRVEKPLVWPFSAPRTFKSARGTLSSGPWEKIHRTLNHILQLANVSRPWIANQRVHGLGRDGVDRLGHIEGEMLREVPNQERNIFGPLAQRRNVNGKNVQAVEQIGAELLLFYHRPQIAIGRGNEPGVVRRVREPPKRSYFRSCRTRNSLGCNSRGISPTSSRKMVPWEANQIAQYAAQLRR